MTFKILKVYYPILSNKKTFTTSSSYKPNRLIWKGRKLLLLLTHHIPRRRRNILGQTFHGRESCRGCRNLPPISWRILAWVLLTTALGGWGIMVVEYSGQNPSQERSIRWFPNYNKQSTVLIIDMLLFQYTLKKPIINTNTHISNELRSESTIQYHLLLHISVT